MQRLALVHDDLFRAHDTGHGHPERPARLEAIDGALRSTGLLATALRVAPTPVALELLHRLHAPDYVARVKAACEAGRTAIDEPDCAIGPGSYEIALHAAGAVAQTARHVASGAARRGFCAVRPPGHHAERERARGFCLFGNVAVAAEVFRSEFALERVLILDWDVHHGNGTQHIFESDPHVLFISLHGHPDYLYPGSGYVHETGIGPGEGFTLNVPLLPGTAAAAYKDAFTKRVVPAIEAFEPQAVIVSCGFDAHREDPLGNLQLEDDTFAWLLRKVLGLAERYAGGRLLSVLEGGYNLDVLGRCVAQHVQLLNDS